MDTKIPREKETKIQSSIRVRCRALGIVLLRRNAGAMRDGERFVRFASPGQADLYGWEIRTGRHWEIEVKRPGNRPTPKQLEWLMECSRLGAVAFWADSVNIAERVAQAVVNGGKIVWLEGDDYNVEV